VAAAAASSAPEGAKSAEGCGPCRWVWSQTLRRVFYALRTCAASYMDQISKAVTTDGGGLWTRAGAVAFKVPRCCERTVCRMQGISRRGES
jgi:hypothetical protein